VQSTGQDEEHQNHTKSISINEREEFSNHLSHASCKALRTYPMTWLWRTVLVECQPVQRQSSKILTNLHCPRISRLKLPTSTIDQLDGREPSITKKKRDGGSADPNRSGPYTWQRNRLTERGRRQFDRIFSPLFGVVAGGWSNFCVEWIAFV
jgi:hypothetical protein